MDNYNQIYISEEMKAAQTALMTRVYKWMALALLITGFTAYGIANSGLVNVIFSNSFSVWGLFIAQIAIVMILSARLEKMSDTTASILYILYSVLTGVTLSTIFLAYTQESIASCFFITAGTFGAMSIYGTVTKRDLTTIGNLCIMALTGVILATIINFFFNSGSLAKIINYVAVLIFVGLTAYDTQKIRNMLLVTGDSEVTYKLSIIGALSLYLDFINLFLYLLRILGSRRD